MGLPIPSPVRPRLCLAEVRCDQQEGQTQSCQETYPRRRRPWGQRERVHACVRAHACVRVCVCVHTSHDAILISAA